MKIMRIIKGYCWVLIGMAVIWTPSCENPRGSIEPLPEDPISVGKSEYTIGLVMHGMNAPYYRGMAVGFEDEMAQRGGAAYVSDAQWKMDKQIADFEDMLTKGVDGIIVNALDPKAMVPSIIDAVESGIPVIAIDSGISEEAPIVTHIQSDSPNNGQLLGRWLVNRMGGKEIKLVVMSGSKGSEEGKRRRLNLISGIAETLMQTANGGSIEIVSQVWGGWNQNEGLTAMEDVLVAHGGNFNVVFAENDSMGMGARQAILDAGITDDITFISVDGQKECYELIQQGNYDATTINNPDLIVRTAVEYMIRYLEGERNIPQKIYTPPMVVTQENVEEYYNPNAVF